MDSKLMNRIRKNRLGKKNCPNSDIKTHIVETIKEAPKTDKDTEDDLLQRLAEEELLREAQRGATRAETAGPTGWLKCPLLKTNKRFLKNTLKSAVGSNKKNEPRKETNRSSVYKKGNIDDKKEFPLEDSTGRSVKSSSTYTNATHDKRNRNKKYRNKKWNATSKTISEEKQITREMYFLGLSALWETPNKIAFPGPYPCPKCGETFKTVNTLREHFKLCPGKVPCRYCPHCFSSFKRKSSLFKHIRETHAELYAPPSEIEFGPIGIIMADKFKQKFSKLTAFPSELKMEPNTENIKQEFAKLSTFRWETKIEPNADEQELVKLSTLPWEIKTEPNADIIKPEFNTENIKQVFAKLTYLPCKIKTEPNIGNIKQGFGKRTALPCKIKTEPNTDNIKPEFTKLTNLPCKIKTEPNTGNIKQGLGKLTALPCKIKTEPNADNIKQELGKLTALPYEVKFEPNYDNFDDTSQL